MQEVTATGSIGWKGRWDKEKAEMGRENGVGSGGRGIRGRQACTSGYAPIIPIFVASWLCVSPKRTWIPAFAGMTYWGIRVNPVNPYPISSLCDPLRPLRLKGLGFLLLDQVEDKLRRNDRVRIRVWCVLSVVSVSPAFAGQALCGRNHWVGFSFSRRRVCR